MPATRGIHTGSVGLTLVHEVRVRVRVCVRECVHILWIWEERERESEAHYTCGGFRFVGVTRICSWRGHRGTISCGRYYRALFNKYPGPHRRPQIYIQTNRKLTRTHLHELLRLYNATFTMSVPERGPVPIRAPTRNNNEITTKKARGTLIVPERLLWILYYTQMRVRLDMEASMHTWLALRCSI